MTAWCKPLVFMLAAGLAGSAWPDSGQRAELEVVSGPGRAGELAWQRLEMNYRPASAEAPGSWRLEAAGLRMPGVGELGRVRLQCRHGSLHAAAPRCERGHASWQDGPLQLAWESSFRIEPGPTGVEVILDGDPIRARVLLPADDRALQLSVQISQLDLAAVPEALLEWLDLREVEGHVSGRVELADDRLQAALDLTGIGLDSTDGELAAMGVDGAASLVLDLGDAGTAFDLILGQTDGEMLLGSIYLPPPAGELTVTAQGQYFPAEGRLAVAELTVLDPEAVDLRGALELTRGDDGWTVAAAGISEARLQFPGGWERWLDGPLAAAGMAGLETAGTATVSLDWEDGALRRLGARLQEFHLDDPAGRFGLDDVAAEIDLADAGFRAQATWRGLELYGLPLRGATLRLEGDDRYLGLAEPLHVPILDGAVVIERLRWDHGEPGDRELELDARIEPLDLAALTRLLEFPEFGGSLSGRFPGVVYLGETLSFTGGIDIEAFSGRIQLNELAVERPFGTLPALSAQVEFHRLNLAELTGAFNFGHMEGQLSGWMRNLRLLDWRPVAMDARVFTHDDAPRRRISQRAVENLSNLGGAGGALISGTVLRVFKEFPYRRAGLACRLSNNICYIDGVASHESGGFYIIQGRSLPRLDIIGHRRLVDWPQLMSQLEAMLED